MQSFRPIIYLVSPRSIIAGRIERPANNFFSLVHQPSRPNQHTTPHETQTYTPKAAYETHSCPPSQPAQPMKHLPTNPADPTTITQNTNTTYKTHTIMKHLSANPAGPTNAHTNTNNN